MAVVVRRERAGITSIIVSIPLVLILVDYLTGSNGLEKVYEWVGQATNDLTYFFFLAAFWTYSALLIAILLELRSDFGMFRGVFALIVLCGIGFSLGYLLMEKSPEMTWLIFSLCGALLGTGFNMFVLSNPLELEQQT